MSVSFYTREREGGEKTYYMTVSGISLYCFSTSREQVERSLKDHVCPRASFVNFTYDKFVTRGAPEWAIKILEIFAAQFFRFHADTMMSMIENDVGAKAVVDMFSTEEKEEAR